METISLYSFKYYCYGESAHIMATSEEHAISIMTSVVGEGGEKGDWERNQKHSVYRAILRWYHNQRGDTHTNKDDYKIVVYNLGEGFVTEVA